MTGFLALVNRAFDLFFGLLNSFHPVAILAMISMATALLFLLVFRGTSDQKAIHRIKDRIGARVLEVRLFPDQLKVVLRAYLRLLGSVVLYLRYSLKPLLFLAVPLSLILIQMEAYFDRMPVEPGHYFLLKLRFLRTEPLPEVTLGLPPGLDLTAPALHVPQEKEVEWRLKAERPGTYPVSLVVAGQTYEKRVVVGDLLSRLSATRVRDGLWQKFLHPGETLLPKGGPLEEVEIQYPARTFRFWSWEMHWMIPFLVFSLGAAFLLKGVFRTEI